MKFRNQAMMYGTIRMEEAGADGAAAGGGGETPVAEPEAAPEAGSDHTSSEPQPEPEVEPTQEPEAEKPSAEDLYEGSDFFDAATDIFAKGEINGQVIVDFYQDNDGTFAPEHIALMEKRLGKAQAQMMMNGIVNEIKGQADAEVQKVNDIYEAVGGETNFKQAAEWAASEASGFDQQDKDDINEMLNMGGNFSKWAAQLLHIGFTNAGGQSAQPSQGSAQLVEGHKAPVKGTEPIKFADYRNAIQKATSQAETDAIVKRANYTRSLGNSAEFGWKYG